MTNLISTAILILIVTFLGWYYASSDIFSDEVTVYNLWCSKERIDGKCLGKEEPANPITYKALVDQQTVIYWFEGGALTKLDNCAVKDSENWSCESGSYHHYMINGIYHEDYPHKVKSTFYQGPRWKWTFLYLKMRFNGEIS